MPRGRPKGSKNKSTLAKMNLLDIPVVTEEVTPSAETPVILEPKKDIISKNAFKCDICEKTVIGNPYTLDFTRLTGKADYYREARSKRMSVCNECSKEISSVIDKWLLKKNPNLRKFSIEVEDDEA